MVNHWQTNTGLSRDDFEKFTRYCNLSDNRQDNLNRAAVIGIKSEDTRVAFGAVVRIKDLSCIGRNCFIGLFCYMNGYVTLEDNVLIGPHCSLPAGNHVFSVETGYFSDRSDLKASAIVIKEGSWLTSGCTVTAGVTVGRKNLICANSVVTRNTPDYAIMAGTPARQIGTIDKKTGEYIWLE